MSCRPCTVKSRPLPLEATTYVHTRVSKPEGTQEEPSIGVECTEADDEQCTRYSADYSEDGRDRQDTDRE